MLYTGKGDNGTTGLFSTKGGPASGWGCDQRISKSSNITEALGSLDEINSFLGLVKVKAGESKFSIGDKTFESIVHRLQENLFTVQAEIAGADKHIDAERVKEVEDLIAVVEKELPPIKTFFISGGTELGALFDISRTIARRAERRVVAVSEEGTVKVGVETLRFLNRLSSILYAFARLSNHMSGIKESAPSYN